MRIENLKNTSNVAGGERGGCYSGTSRFGSKLEPAGARRNSFSRRECPIMGTQTGGLCRKVV